MFSKEKEYQQVSTCTFEVGQLLPSANGTWQLVRGNHGPQVLPESNEDNSSRPSSPWFPLPCVCSRDCATVRITSMDRIGDRTPENGNNRRNMLSSHYSSVDPFSSSLNAPPPRWRADTHFHEVLRVPQKQHLMVSDASQEQDAKSQDELMLEADGLLCQLECMARESIAIALSPKPTFVKGQTYEIYFGANGNTATQLVQRNTKIGEKVNRHVTVPGMVCHETRWTKYWVGLLQGRLYAGLGPIPGKHCIAILDRETTQQERSVEGYASSGADAPLTTTQSLVHNDDEIQYVGFGNAPLTDRNQSTTPLKLRNIRLSRIPGPLQVTLNELVHDRLETIASDEEDDVVNTEMDLEKKALLHTYQEECQKARVRAAKFGIPYQEPPPDRVLPWSQARRMRANPLSGFSTGLDLSDPTELARQDARKKRFQSCSTDSTERVSADHDVTTESMGDGEGIDEDTAIPASQAWDNEELVRSQRTDPPPSLWIRPPSADEISPDKDKQKGEFDITSKDPATWTPERIHLFGIDWAAFKQIRTNDVMRLFSLYGPSYVEWLGDLSCNVWFQDKFSAARAMDHLSQPIPSLDEDHAVYLLSSATQPRRPDLGNMGWRMGRTMIRKVANDAFGRRGTTARFLLRLSTSLDLLQKRPSAWPKPPPGFSKKRVLGPGCDFVVDHSTAEVSETETKNAKRRRTEDNVLRNGQGSIITKESESHEPHLLNRPLSASR